VEQNPSCEDKSHSASKEIPCLPWNLRVHYHIHKAHHWSLSWARCIQSVHFHLISLRSILTSSHHYRSSEWSSPFTFCKLNFVCISHYSVLLWKNSEYSLKYQKCGGRRQYSLISSLCMVITEYGAVQLPHTNSIHSRPWSKSHPQSLNLLSFQRIDLF